MLNRNEMARLSRVGSKGTSSGLHGHHGLHSLPGLFGAVVGVAFAATALSSTAVLAEDGESWEEVAGLQLVLNDEVDGLARVFDSPDYQHQLVVPSGEVPAFVLALKAQTVAQLPAESIAWTESDMPIPSTGDAADLGMFFNDDGILSFDADAGHYVVQPEPPLVGTIAADVLAKHKPDYVHAAGKYKPDAESVAVLKAVKNPTTIKVFFGTWCSYCKHYLPHLMKAVEASGSDKFTIEYVGVSEDQSEPADLLGKHDVSLTPTFVVLQGGKELGRFEEEPIVSVEADLAHMLKGK